MTPQKPPITCTRRIEFDAAHRVMGHEGKCKHLHGHRYALEARVATPAAYAEYRACLNDTFGPQYVEHLERWLEGREA